MRLHRIVILRRGFVDRFDALGRGGETGLDITVMLLRRKSGTDRLGGTKLSAASSPIRAASLS